MHTDARMHVSGDYAATFGVTLRVRAGAPVLGLHGGLDGRDVSAAAGPRRLATALALDGGAHQNFGWCGSTVRRAQHGQPGTQRRRTLQSARHSALDTMAGVQNDARAKLSRGVTEFLSRSQPQRRILAGGNAC